MLVESGVAGSWAYTETWKEAKLEGELGNSLLGGVISDI